MNPQESDRSGPASSAARPTKEEGAPNSGPSTTGNKKRKHRGGKRRKNRRQSFIAPPSEASVAVGDLKHTPSDPLMEAPERASPAQAGSSFYQRRLSGSNDSLNSDVLFDHRDQPAIKYRRESRHNTMPASYLGMNLGPPHNRPSSGGPRAHRRRRTNHASSDEGDTEREEANDRSPLITGPAQHRSPVRSGYGIFKSNTQDSSSSHNKKDWSPKSGSYGNYRDKPDYDINNPPSMPPSPQMHAQVDDVMMPEGQFLSRSPAGNANTWSPGGSRKGRDSNRDLLVDIDGDTADDGEAVSEPNSPRTRPEHLQRHRTITLPVEGDVCFPTETMSDLGDDDLDHHESRDERSHGERRSRRKRDWPQLWVLDDWSREEKEERAAGERRTQKIREPVLVEGRLRPSRLSVWHRTSEEIPYRYTYFNDEFESTIHAQTISELVQPGGNFRELFLPDPPLLSDSSESESESGSEPSEERREARPGVLSPKSSILDHAQARHAQTHANLVQSKSRVDSILHEHARSRSRDTEGGRTETGQRSQRESGENTPHAAPTHHKSSPKSSPKAKKYGPRPTWWLDVTCPTDQEMRVLAKAFGIHALTAEDIMMQEAREKVELFKNYYFINYRTFEQDSNDEDYLEPINMYVIVFREGIITFHFSQIPHPANVRRRIRQLTDYLILSADWISYAIIDDITDVYGPLIHNIETEVDDIDELILNAFHETNALHEESGPLSGLIDDKSSDSGKSGPSGIELLRRIGECRKKVMSLYRLLGNKADVIKGFAKRCNEQWAVAPKTEIGLYLGDIQDHILTMTSNLSHYETLLSRAHSNYLAQVSIRMNERQEQNGDVLGKLTVLGTIVLPMNIICGMWGMNVKVPGQEIDNLWWFWGITAFLIFFAVSCFVWCKRVYGIV